MRIPPITDKRLKQIKDTVTWVAPAIGIPALRYFQDRKEQRNELFVRDASTYSIGALTFLGVFFGGKFALKRYAPTLNHWFRQKLGAKKPVLYENSIELISFLSALSANIAYAGIGSVRLSQFVSRLQGKEPQQLPPAVKSIPPTTMPLRQPMYFPNDGSRLSYQA